MSKNSEIYKKPIYNLIKRVPSFISSSNANLIMSNLNNKEEMIIKITKNNDNKVNIINNVLTKLQNFPLIYSTIRCDEYMKLLNTKYIIEGDKVANTFSNGIKKDELITLEITKYHKKSITKKLLQNKMNDLKQLKCILDQALAAQLIAFEKYGFLYNNMNYNNILIHKENFEYNYNINYRQIKVKGYYKIYLIDFTNSDLLDPKYRIYYTPDYIENDLPNIKYRNSNNTLPHNIYNTFILFTKMLDDIKLIKMIESALTNGIPTLDYYVVKYNKLFNHFYNKNEYEYCITKNIHIIIEMINEYYDLLFGIKFII